MSETKEDRPLRRPGLVDLVRRFRPACDHLLAAQREVLLAARSVLDTQIEILEEWRSRHTRPRPAQAERVG